LSSRLNGVTTQFRQIADHTNENTDRDSCRACGAPPISHLHFLPYLGCGLGPHRTVYGDLFVRCRVDRLAVITPRGHAAWHIANQHD
jgi:hypothetical protein